MLVSSFKTSYHVIDISHFSGYNELRYNIALSFGIEELLPGIEGWEITYFRSPRDVELHFGSESWQ